MRYRRLGRTDLQISEIGLGTVELGIDYGIRTGQNTNQPSEQDAGRLLNHALDQGVNLIDTAADYGTSEEIIGRALRGRREEYVLATKSLHWSDKGLPVTEVRERVETSIDQSLRHLGTDVIDLMQIHGRDVPFLEIMMVEEGDVFDVLDRARQAGKIRYIGYSSYSEEAAQAVIDNGQWDTLQIAYSIFDQRNALTIIPAAAAGDMGVIIRSALLKGALTEKSKHLPERLAPLAERTRALESLLATGHPTIPQLALRFVLSNTAISSIIVGADRIPHVEEAVSVSDGVGLPNHIYDQTLSLAIDDPELINPSTWGIP